MHELLWDLRQTPHARELLEYLCDDWRHLVAGFIDTYEEHVASRIGSLRVQVIHNDINPHNVLVADANPESISGIIDFGDMLTAPLVHDIAISAAYAVADTADLLEAICELAGGFCEVVHLEPNEIEVLIILSTPVSCSSQRSQLGEPRSIPTTPSIFCETHRLHGPVSSTSRQFLTGVGMRPFEMPVPEGMCDDNDQCLQWQQGLRTFG
jgi:hypothetical protein